MDKKKKATSSYLIFEGEPNLSPSTFFNLKSVEGATQLHWPNLVWFLLLTLFYL